jgi:hypothetical protein
MLLMCHCAIMIRDGVSHTADDLVSTLSLSDNIEKVRSNSMKPSFSPRYFETDTMPDDKFQSFSRRESSPAIVSI